MSEKTLVLETAWDGPVMVNDRFWSDIDEAIEYYWDDCYDSAAGKSIFDEVPEFIECCDRKVPTFDATDWIKEHIAENHPVNEDSTPFDEWVTQVQEQELKASIDNWIKSTNWDYWEPNGKYLPLRSQVIALTEERAKEET